MPVAEKDRISLLKLVSNLVFGHWILELLASIRASSPLNNIPFVLKSNRLPDYLAFDLNHSSASFIS